MVSLNLEEMKMKRTTVVLSLVLLLSLSLLSATGSKETVEKKRMTFGGSSTAAPIIAGAIPAYEAKHNDVAITYETLGSSVGIKSLEDGTLTLAGSSRELKESEIALGDKAVPVALDGLSVVVHGDVAIDNLTMNELASIFSGEITNWKDVGGNDEKIVLVVRDETSGTYGSFKEIVLDNQKKAPTKEAIVAKENGELAAKVASTPGAVGYCGMAFASTVKARGGSVLSIEGIDPTSKNVKNGTYPISRSLFMVSKGEPGEVERSFIDFLLSKEGQAIVEENGFITIR